MVHPSGHIQKFIAYISGVRRYSPRTQELYSDVLQEFVEYAGAATDSQLPESLVPTVLRSYEVHLLDIRKLSPRTVNQHLSVLSSFCSFLVKEGILPCNPTKTVVRPKMEKRLPVFYREEFMQEYFTSTLSAASADSLSLVTGHDKASESMYVRRLNRMIVSLLHGTGIRRSELLSLSIASVDFGRSVLKVAGKGDKMREIPLFPSLCEEISLYLQSVEAMEGRARSAQEPLLVSTKGEKLYPVFIDRAVKSELGQVGSITGRKSPHVLRHTLATELLNEGADLNAIKELLGHASLAATQVYTHNSVEKLKKVYNNAHPRAKSRGKHGD